MIGKDFAGLAPGTLAASAFKDLSQGAEDADDRILCEAVPDHSDLGYLLYDADGAGGSGPTAFAFVQDTGGQPISLSASDFTVFFPRQPR